jgi:Ser/Thr protein kinase RdoA (MazF antagonist)
VANVRSLPKGGVLSVLTIGHEVFTVAIFDLVSGLIGDEMGWGPAIFREWGRVMACLHSISQQYLAPGPVRRTWEQNLPTQTAATEDEEIAVRRIRGLRDELKAQLKTGMREYGLIHADLHYWNFAVQGDFLTVFDFDNCEYHWYAYDVATAVFEAATCRHQTQPLKFFLHEFLESFAQGYSSVADFPDVRVLAAMIRLRELFMFLTLAERWRNMQLSAFRQSFFERLRRSVLEDQSLAGPLGK